MTTEPHTGPRLRAIERMAPDAGALVRQLLRDAVRGLAAGYDPVQQCFARTVRPGGAPGAGLHREGISVRYTAIAALGLSRIAEPVQRAVLDGNTAEALARHTAQTAARLDDPGAIALALWAAAETGAFEPALIERLHEIVAGAPVLPTVDIAWMLTAAVATSSVAPDQDGPTRALVETAIGLLTRHINRRGSTLHTFYPHRLPPRRHRGGPWLRSHVGSFADQLYPVQALARAARLTGDSQLLEYAGHTARRLCELQGRDGQWWWHYDTRDASLVERYPVYSVHQHAMAPMALFDLWESGGDDHRRAVAAGLEWLDRHPEVAPPLVDHALGVVWRKVGRREPRKLARALGAVTTAVRPGWHLPGLDRLLPATETDHECRPYELGWLLYAWLPSPLAGQDRP